jgi:hypothetical protein
MKLPDESTLADCAIWIVVPLWIALLLLGIV